MTEEELRRWEPYALLRRRLKSHIGMSFYDGPGRWLQMELKLERDALADKLPRPPLGAAPTPQGGAANERVTTARRHVPVEAATVASTASE